MKLRPSIILLLLSVAVVLQARNNVIVVENTSGAALLEAIEKANTQNASPKARRLFVFIPNGVYDLGETVLTPILGHNIAFVGESTEGVIIRNAPPVEKEGISSTAVFLNRGQNNYVQDLTLQNALDYYHSGAAGRAVCWQDKGNRTIFKRVKMLSYQDTYYTHSEECQHYLEDTEIHGTVDFICGAGDVYFNRCTFVTEKRMPDGSGSNVIAAPRTSTTEWGYVFDHCTIRSDVSKFTFARAWHTHPRCVWLHTRIESPELLKSTRFDPQGIRAANVVFGEYGTTDGQGRNITPESNVLHFVGKEEESTQETIIGPEEAARFTVKNVYGKWEPDKIVRLLEKKIAKLKGKYFNK